MTDFEAAVILATVKRDPGLRRGVLCAATGLAVGRPTTDEGVILTQMDSLESLRLIQRFHSYGGYFITPSGDDRLKQIRSKLQLGLNVINASY